MFSARWKPVLAAAVVVIAAGAGSCERKNVSRQRVEGTPRAAVHSGVRADWPCRMEGHGRMGSIVQRFAYDGPTSCQIPLEEVAQGVLGCPTKVLARSQLSGDHFIDAEVSYSYDIASRLSTARALIGASRYRWGALGLVGRDSAAGELRYVARGRVVQLLTFLGGEVGRMSLDKRGRLVQFADTAATHVLTWEGARLAEVVTRHGAADGEVVARFRLVYDCRDTDRRPEPDGGTSTGRQRSPGSRINQTR